MYSETCANMNLEDPLATGFQSGPLPQEPCTSSKDHSPEGSIPVSSDNATRESSSAPEAEPAPKRGARGDKGKPRSGNAENQARYRARCKTKRMGLEGVYQSTKEALEREQRESARLTLDTAVLTGILSVRDMSIKVLEGPQEGPEALNDSPSNPGLNVRSGEGISPRLHAEVKQYLEHVERLFMDLALAEGCSRQCVTSLDLTWDQLVEYGEEVRGMTETQFCAALDSFRDAAREVIAELDGTGSRLCLLQMVGAWQSMACMHSVATACRPDLVMATMAQAQAAVRRDALPDAGFAALARALRLSPAQVASLGRVHRQHVAMLCALGGSGAAQRRSAAAAVATGAAAAPAASLAGMMDGYLEALSTAAALERYLAGMNSLVSSYCSQVFMVLGVEQALRWIGHLPRGFPAVAAFVEHVLATAGGAAALEAGEGETSAPGAAPAATLAIAGVTCPGMRMV
ncbi:hypothetical protein F751_1185 [Auxenochlorella protothecoides]|uniref:BZIP domain-containing protein n=1 Tax=Auxenochlorella protothecoides TaxID=3075 RepID=A0A087SNV4_AUXPR|nr:hypothetical protein F751_1185 [Auxenochlorella protothecoides]KFM27408.1 hypothetical protein F751_1185 [Auxenochlorella protothecoides]